MDQDADVTSHDPSTKAKSSRRKKDFAWMGKSSEYAREFESGKRRRVFKTEVERLLGRGEGKEA